MPSAVYLAAGVLRIGIGVKRRGGSTEKKNIGL